MLVLTVRIGESMLKADLMLSLNQERIHRLEALNQDYIEQMLTMKSLVNSQQNGMWFLTLSLRRTSTQLRQLAPKRCKTLLLRLAKLSTKANRLAKPLARLRKSWIKVGPSTRRHL